MCVGVLRLLSQIAKVHGDHRALFFLYIKELNVTFLAEGLEFPSDALIQFLVEHHLNMPLSDFNLIVINDVKRTLHTAGISQEADLLSCEVTYDRDLTLNSIVST